MATCNGCGLDRTCAPGGLCFEVDAKGERVIGSGCYGLAETSEAARLDALATALGCDRSEVNPDTLGVAAQIAKCTWHEVTPEKLVGKLTVTRAAVAAALDGAK